MKLQLVKKIKEAKDTNTFVFKPQKPIDWLPGQYFYYDLKGVKNDSRGASRQFTIASSPTEKILMLTTRMRKSGYKNVLNGLKVGSVVEGEGPSGTFMFDGTENEKSHVFLAGGIGVTPFRAFIKYNIDKDLKVHTCLIYSNSLPEEITYRKELEGWAKKYKFFTLYQTITGDSVSPKWKEGKGRIDLQLVKRLTKDMNLKNTVFWIVGPPHFVYAMEDIVERMKVPLDNVRFENFTGY